MHRRGEVRGQTPSRHARETGISVPTADFSSFTIPSRRAVQQPSRPCCSVPLTHELQQYNNRKKGLLCFHSQVPSPSSLRRELVIIINNCGASWDKPSAFQNAPLCLWDGVARADKSGRGGDLKAFYFGQRFAHHRQQLSHWQKTSVSDESLPPSGNTSALLQRWRSGASWIGGFCFIYCFVLILTS